MTKSPIEIAAEEYGEININEPKAYGYSYVDTFMDGARFVLQEAEKMKYKDGAAQCYSVDLDDLRKIFEAPK